jgi:hypothetical protein
LIFFAFFFVSRQKRKWGLPTVSSPFGLGWGNAPIRKPVELEVFVEFGTENTKRLTHLVIQPIRLNLKRQPIIGQTNIIG